MSTKKEKAQAVYNAMATAGTLTRKAFIDAMVKDHGMTPAGASTYYVNCKNTANGVEVKSYYKPASEKAVSQAVDDSKENAPMWSIVVADGLQVNDKSVKGKVESVHAFMSEDAAITRYKRLNESARARCVVVEGAPKEGVSLAELNVLATAASVK